jgi:hypothetical protein
MPAKKKRVELRAIKFAKRYYKNNGWEKITDVSGRGGEFAGCDLLIEKGSRKWKVEVKGCTKLYGIPDLYDSEIDRKSKRLKADALLIVYYLPGEKCRLAIIPRKDIAPGNVVRRTMYRLRRFKNKKTMDRFFVKI